LTDIKERRIFVKGHQRRFCGHLPQIVPNLILHCDVMMSCWGFAKNRKKGKIY